MAIVKTILSDGEELLIETNEPILTSPGEEEDEYRDTPRVVQRMIEDAPDLFGAAMHKIEKCAHLISDTFDKLQESAKPDEVEASLAFKLIAQAGVVLTSIGGEAQLEVKLVWKRNAAPAPEA